MAIEVNVTKSTSTSVTVEKLREIFATRDLPDVIVSDNRPCFSSGEFREFAQRNGIKHSFRSVPSFLQRVGGKSGKNSEGGSDQVKR